MRLNNTAWTLVALLLFATVASAGDGNRMAYLDGPCDPYYAGRELPKLIAPQWAGRPGVEAVIVLAIDDLRDTAKYEEFLRPILDRLKKIDGRAPVSLMTNQIDPQDPQLQRWLEDTVGNLSIHLFTSLKEGWSRRVLSGRRGEKPPEDELPPIVRADGTNNGAWFKERHLWVQNEDTGGKLPGHVDSRSFTEMISTEKRPATFSANCTAAPIRPPDALQPAPDRHARYSRAAGGDDQEQGGPSLSD